MRLSRRLTTYALVYALWCRPLPYPRPKELISVSAYFPNFNFDSLVSPDYGEWQRTQSLGVLGAFDRNSGVTSLAAPSSSTTEPPTFSASSAQLSPSGRSPR